MTRSSHDSVPWLISSWDHETYFVMGWSWSTIYIHEPTKKFVSLAHETNLFWGRYGQNIVKYIRHLVQETTRQISLGGGCWQCDLNISRNIVQYTGLPRDLSHISGRETNFLIGWWWATVWWLEFVRISDTFSCDLFLNLIPIMENHAVHKSKNQRRQRNLTSCFLVKLFSL